MQMHIVQQQWQSSIQLQDHTCELRLAKCLPQVQQAVSASVSHFFWELETAIESCAFAMESDSPSLAFAERAILIARVLYY